MSAEYRIINIHEPFTGCSYWRVSKRKLTDQQLADLFAEGYDFDHITDLGLCFAGRFVSSSHTIVGATKKEAEKVCAELNNGVDPLEMLFGEEASDD